MEEDKSLHHRWIKVITPDDLLNFHWVNSNENGSATELEDPYQIYEDSISSISYHYDHPLDNIFLNLISDHDSHLSLRDRSIQMNSLEIQIEEIKPQIIVCINPLRLVVPNTRDTWILTPTWIPLNEYLWKFEIMYQLKERGLAWKRSISDGNSYYRAVMNSYIRLIFDVKRSVNFGASFLKLLGSLNINQPEFENKKIRFIKVIYYLWRIKAKNPVQAFIEFNKLTQDEEFDKLCIEIGRLITAQALIEWKNEKMSRATKSLDLYIGKILKYGENPDNKELNMLSSRLNVQIHVFDILDGYKLNIIKYPEDFKRTASSLPPIFIARTNKHYDILCPKSELDGYMYDFDTGSYSFIIDNNKNCKKTISYFIKNSNL